MSSLQADEIEIVGFNGSPRVECGRSLPVARRKADNAYCVLDLSRGFEAMIWHNSNETAEFAASARWAELHKPVAVPRTCIDPETNAITHQPVVIFENDLLLDVADRIPRPDHHDGHYLQWQPLKEAYPGYFAACASAECVEAILNIWAEGLLTRFDAMIGSARNRTDLKRIADFALCAARSRDLRWKAFLRYASVQESGKVKSTFDRFIHAEFPQVAWDDFIRELKSLRDVWEAQPVFTLDVGVTAVSDSTASKVKDIANAASPSLVRQ